MSENITHIQDQLSSYLDNQLPENERAGVEEHLKGCAECEGRYQDLLHLRQTLRQEPLQTPPESFYLGALARIHASPPRARLTWKIPVTTLASACLVLLIIRVTREARKEAVPAQPIKQIEVAENARQGVIGGKVSTPEKSSTLKETDTSLDDLRSLVNAPTQPLAQRKDVTVQARDINGPAYQNSFDRSQSKAEMPALKNPTVLSKKGAGALQEDERRHLSPDTQTEKMYGMPLPAARAPVNQVSVADKLAAPLSQVQSDWKGMSCGITRPILILVHTSGEWQELWKAHNQITGTPTNVPSIDFNQFMIAGVYAGEKPSMGYSIEIVNTEQIGQTLVINYQEMSPSPQAAPTPIKTQPFHLRVLPKTKLPIQFRKIE